MAEASSEAPAFPWAQAMRFALGRLRWSPPDFWAATPLELAFAIEGVLGKRRSAPLDRASLEALMARFPD